MSDVEGIVEAVRLNPAQLDLYADECFAVFVTGEPEEQQRIARLLRALAEQAPDVVAGQPRLLGKALGAELLASAEAIHAVATITETQPEAVSGLVSELLEALEAVDDPAAKGSAVRALAVIGNETDTSVSEGDELFATLLRDGNSAIRDEISTGMSINVMDTPDEFPHLLRAYVDALSDTDPEVQMFAVKTLAVVADDDISSVPEIEEVQSRLQDLRNDYRLDSDTVERAIEVVQQAADGGSG